MIAFAEVSRINRTNLTVHDRILGLVKLYSLVRALFDDSEFKPDIHDLGMDLQVLREKYEIQIDTDVWQVGERNKFNLYLDGIEYRLDKIIAKTKILENAGLKEMYVPD